MGKQLVQKEEVEKAVLELIKAVNSIVDAIDASSKSKREEWMKKIVPSLMNENPGYNVVVCHVPFRWNGKGLKAHMRHEISGYFGLKHYDFDILIFKEGRFIREGDGGWLNWGYCGPNVTKNGNVFDFRASENRSLEYTDDGVDAEEEDEVEGYGASLEEDEISEEYENSEYEENRSLEETEMTIEDEYDGTPLTLGT